MNVAQLANSSALRKALTAIDPQQLLRRAIAVQQIPAPTFEESERAAHVAEQFAILNLKDISTDELGNVYARLPGGARRPVLVTAHLDTVFPRDTDLTIRHEAGRIYGPGLGDNSIGVAGLLALAETIGVVELALPGDLWLAANVGEEGLGDLRGMRRVMDRLGNSVVATIVLEGMALGHVYHKGIGVRRYCIQAKADGGHSWLHYGQPSAIHALVQLADRLTRIELPTSPRTTYNIGRISGGTSVNTIARHAELELDLRSEDDQVLSDLAGQVEQLVSEASQEHDADITATVCGARPSGRLALDHPLMQIAVEALRYVGHGEPQLERGSTDANIPLSRGLPAVAVGLTRGGNTHRPDEYVETAPIKAGMEQLLLLVLGAYQIGK